MSRFSSLRSGGDIVREAQAARAGNTATQRRDNQRAAAQEASRAQLMAQARGMGLGTGEWRQTVGTDRLAEVIANQTAARARNAANAAPNPRVPDVFYDEAQWNPQGNPQNNPNAITTANIPGAGYFRQELADAGVGSNYWRQNASLAELQDTLNRHRAGLPYNIVANRPGTGADLAFREGTQGTIPEGMELVRYDNGTLGLTSVGDAGFQSPWGHMGPNNAMITRLGTNLLPDAQGYIPGYGVAPGLREWNQNFDDMRGQYHGYRGYLDATYPGGYDQWTTDYGLAQAGAFGVDYEGLPSGSINANNLPSNYQAATGGGTTTTGGGTQTGTATSNPVAGGAQTATSGNPYAGLLALLSGIYGGTSGGAGAGGSSPFSGLQMPNQYQNPGYGGMPFLRTPLFGGYQPSFFNTGYGTGGYPGYSPMRGYNPYGMYGMRQSYNPYGMGGYGGMGGWQNPWAGMSSYGYGAPMHQSNPPNWRHLPPELAGAG